MITRDTNRARRAIFIYLDVFFFQKRGTQLTSPLLTWHFVKCNSKKRHNSFFLNSPLVRHSKETCAQHDEHHDLFAGKNLSRDDDDVVVVVIFSSFLLFEEQTRCCGDERDEGTRILFPQTHFFAM